MSIQHSTESFKSKLTEPYKSNFESNPTHANSRHATLFANQIKQE
jgi:hypothetical protein